MCVCAYLNKMYMHIYIYPHVKERIYRKESVTNGLETKRTNEIIISMCDAME